MGFDWLGTIGRIRLESRLEVVKRIQPLVLVFLNRFVERRAEEIAHIDVVDCSQLFEFSRRDAVSSRKSATVSTASSAVCWFASVTHAATTVPTRTVVPRIRQSVRGSRIVHILCSGCFLRRGQRVVATSAVRCATPFPEEGFPRFEVPVLKTVEDTSIKLMVVHKTGEAFTLWVGDEPFGR